MITSWPSMEIWTPPTQICSALNAHAGLCFAPVSEVVSQENNVTTLLALTGHLLDFLGLVQTLMGERM